MCSIEVLDDPSLVFYYWSSTITCIGKRFSTHYQQRFLYFPHAPPVSLLSFKQLQMLLKSKFMTGVAPKAQFNNAEPKIIILDSLTVSTSK